MNALKTVGCRDAAATPAQSLKTALQLRRMAAKLGKWRPARGFVVKGKTWEEAELKWQESIKRTGQS